MTSIITFNDNRFIVDSYHDNGPVLESLIPIEDVEDSQSSIYMEDASNDPSAHIIQVIKYVFPEWLFVT